MIKEGKTRIYNLSSDNQTTKKDLELLKDNNNFKDVTINSLTSQLDNLTLSCASTKIAAYKENEDFKRQYEEKNHELSKEKQNLLMQNEQIIREISQLKQNLSNIQNQNDFLNKENSQLTSDKNKLQEKIDKKDETIKTNSELIFITEDKLKTEKQIKNDIQNKLDKISFDHEQLLNENSHLQNSIESLKQQSKSFEIFSAEKTDLQNQVNDLKSDNSILRSQIQDLQRNAQQN